MEVGVGALWHVIVDDNVDSLDIHSPTKQVRGHHNPLVEALEGLVLGQPVCAHVSMCTYFEFQVVCVCVWGGGGGVCVVSPLLLRHSTVNAYRWEVLLHKQLRQSHAPLNRLHKDDHLRTHTEQ